MSIGSRRRLGLVMAIGLIAIGVIILRDDRPSVTPTATDQDWPNLTPCMAECQESFATDVFVGRVLSRAPGTPVPASTKSRT